MISKSKISKLQGERFSFLFLDMWPNTPRGDEAYMLGGSETYMPRKGRRPTCIGAYNQMPRSTFTFYNIPK